MLIGGQPWRNWAVAFNEVGWWLSGSLLAVRDVACRRASLWCLPADDLYRQAFCRAGHCCPSSWAALSLRLLTHWGLPDWPDRPANVATLVQYKALVVKTLRTRFQPMWLEVARRHASDVDYLSICNVFACDVQGLRVSLVGWDLHCALASFVKLRANLLVLAGRQGKVSSVRLQDCIFCGSRVERPRVHVICFCNEWTEWRSSFIRNAGLDSHVVPSVLAHAVLRTDANHPGFAASLLWAKELERCANAFWDQCP